MNALNAFIFLCIGIIFSGQATENALQPLPELPSVFRAFDYYEEAVACEKEQKGEQAIQFFKKTAAILKQVPFGPATEYYRRDLKKRGFLSRVGYDEWLDLKYSPKFGEEFLTLQQTYASLYQNSQTLSEIRKQFNAFLFFPKKKKKFPLIENLKNLKKEDQKLFLNSLHILGNLYLSKSKEMTEVSQSNFLRNLGNSLLITAIEGINFRTHVKFFKDSSSQNKNIEVTLKYLDVDQEIYQKNPTAFLCETQRLWTMVEKLLPGVEREFFLLQTALLGSADAQITLYKNKHPLGKLFLRYAALNSNFTAFYFLHTDLEETIDFDIEQALRRCPEDFGKDSASDDDNHFKETLKHTLFSYRKGVRLLPLMENKSFDLNFSYIAHVRSLIPENTFPQEIIQHTMDQFNKGNFTIIWLIDLIYGNHPHFCQLPEFNDYLNFLQSLEKTHPITYLTIMNSLGCHYIKLAEKEKNFDLLSQGLTCLDTYVRSAEKTVYLHTLVSEIGSVKEKEYYLSKTILNRDFFNSARVSNWICNYIINNNKTLMIKDNQPLDLHYHLEILTKSGSELDLIYYTYLYLTGRNNVAKNVTKAADCVEVLVDSICKKMQKGEEYMEFDILISTILEYIIPLYLTYQDPEFHDSFRQKFAHIPGINLILQKIKEKVGHFLWAEEEIAKEIVDDIIAHSFTVLDKKRKEVFVKGLIEDILNKSFDRLSCKEVSSVPSLPEETIPLSLPELEDTFLPTMEQIAKEQKELHEYYQEQKRLAVVLPPVLPEKKIEENFDDIKNDLQQLKLHPIKYRKFLKMINKEIKKFGKGSLEMGKGSGKHVKIEDQRLDFHAPHGKKDTSVKGGVIESFVKTVTKTMEAQLP